MNPYEKVFFLSSNYQLEIMSGWKLSIAYKAYTDLHTGK